MNSKKIVSFVLLLLFTLSQSGCKDSEKEDIIKSDSVADSIVNVVNPSVNSWIYNTLDMYYLWTSTMPAYKSSKDDPKSYYYTLLNDLDKWSYLTDDYSKLSNSLGGVEKSVGTSLSLYLYDDVSNRVIAIVEFTYANSPAEAAGLKRGDIILSVNDQQLNTDNYYELLYQAESQALTLGTAQFDADDKFVDFKEDEETISLNAIELDQNPIVHYEIIEQDGLKIGYLVYTGFVSNYNSAEYAEGNFPKPYLSDVFSDLKDKNVTNIILDLRYNPGGDSYASNYLCSSLAPKNVVENNSVLVYRKYNSEFQKFLEENNYKSFVEVRFMDSVEVNLDLSKLVVLTTKGTASASELVITALDPYMDVVTVGDTTTGKYAGSMVFPDDDEKWAVMPIVSKYTNINGVTDFVNGLAPDYYIKEGALYPFGDLDDPILAKAVELYTGSAIVHTRSLNINSLPLKWVGSAGRNRVIQDGIMTIDLK